MIAVSSFTLTYIVLERSSWPLGITLRHIASAPNCDAARNFGLAPSSRGQPGYYDRHDRDDDGIACEPWPPHDQ
ncbi:excalibur calcium-binding domain-containing protein [Pararhizobium haloflavum]|uniref:excalibur calcium-binding domain-containing protein n=1 Tax=Pararhizobium haloflavum TaxID=2037914 RepID=UPI0018E4A909|nr:excalibur calcium-binding domain-containing protein [Pararhizobium haloflavum]